LKEKTSEAGEQTKDTKTEIRVQAVFAMLKGEGIRSVSEETENKVMRFCNKAAIEGRAAVCRIGIISEPKSF